MTFAASSQSKLTYYGLCNAIPQNWNHLLKEFNPSAHTGSEYAENNSLNEISCKSASRFLVGLKFIPFKAEQTLLQAKFDRKTIDAIYIFPLKATKNIGFAIFQFKIIHHRLPSNATLSEIRLLNMTSVISAIKSKLYNIFLCLALTCKLSGKVFITGGMLKTTISSNWTITP